LRSAVVFCEKKWHVLDHVPEVNVDRHNESHAQSADHVPEANVDHHIQKKGDESHAPLRAIPLRAIPLRAIPLRAIPLRGAELFAKEMKNDVVNVPRVVLIIADITNGLHNAVEFFQSSQHLQVWVRKQQPL
jgi:hypothetical protein